MSKEDLDLKLSDARRRLDEIYQEGFRAYDILSTEVNSVISDLLRTLETDIGEYREPVSDLDKERYRIATLLIDALTKATQVYRRNNGDS